MRGRVWLDGLLKRLIRPLLAMAGCREEERLDALTQFFKFCLVGFSNAAVAYVTNIAALRVLQGFAVSWDYLGANAVSFVISVLWAFFWNDRLVFERGGRRGWLRALLRTYLVYGFTGILLNSALAWLLVERLGVSKQIAPLLYIAAGMPINFLLNKKWAFRSEGA